MRSYFMLVLFGHIRSTSHLMKVVCEYCSTASNALNVNQELLNAVYRNTWQIPPILTTTIYT